MDADYATDEIKELARGLLYDPLRIYTFVRNQITYEHYYGCKKGAALTLLEKSGNDFDQCALLVSLLREAALHNPGILPAITYQYGSVGISGADFHRWLGFPETDMSFLRQYAIESGGWPLVSELPRAEARTQRNTWMRQNRLKVARVWVRAVIDGTPQLLDLSFKTSAWIGGISDMPGAMGYSRAQLLGNAGGIETADFVQNMNATAIGSYLHTKFLALREKACLENGIFARLARCKTSNSFPVRWA